MKRLRTFLGVTALLVLLPLTACSAPPSSTEARDLGGVEMNDGGAVGGSAADSSVTSPESMVMTDDRSIIRTGSLDLEVESVSEASEEIASIVDRLGGEVASQQVSGDGDATQNGSITLRVPTDSFNEAFDAFSEVGTVRSEQRGSDDVTEVHVDLAARVKALETSVGRLTDLLETAESTSDLLEIESALSARQAELDGLKAQLESLEGQIEQATISIWMTEPSVLPGGGPQNFWEALKAGVASIGSFASGLVIFVGIILPWLLILGVIAAAVLIPIGIRRKKRKMPTPTESVNNLPRE
ncbi:DUF4349 domain-containing protein [Leucobacter denitrificans]|uniref:DUF4349 domain-containing protein n=1 Tax=Leucobacter denitrificans TaxID=683042 RepID=A0A7G9S6I1_9MICO|nr:DUF4349 domain-containing protein [Leucobacter denitrificans]QNN63456.1 DUF4349 domain-containing protein [Leucobacter denitrificans]